MKIRIKNKTKNILLIVFSCILIFGAIFGLVKLFGNEQETTKVSASAYSVGGLNTNGKYKESKESIYTKNPIGCQGLTTELNFDATVKYQIFFYGQEDNFLTSTNVLTTSYTGCPKLAKFCRIVITPNDDKDIKWYEIRKYANQLKVTVDRNQKFLYEKNLYEVDETRLNKEFNETSLVQTADKTGYQCSKLINVSSFSQLRILVPNTTQSNSIKIYFANENCVVKSIKTLTIPTDKADNTGELYEFIVELPLLTRQIGIVSVIDYDVFVYGE